MNTLVQAVQDEVAHARELVREAVRDEMQEVERAVAAEVIEKTREAIHAEVQDEVRWIVSAAGQ